jgi:protein-L-isoaspartate(D-aspartate) O-methyltransferase
MTTTTADAGLSDSLRQRMTNDLHARGFLHTALWENAFRAVPRETFVQQYMVPSPTGDHRHYDLADPAQRGPALTAVYTDTPLVTQEDAGGTATSSSTAPSLMALMLETLEAQPGMSVLEIGTGTGYNAALLAHALGDTAVTTMDLHPGLVARAQRALHQAGYHPTVVCGDGTLGHPDQAPYDRLMATCGVSRIPAAWLDQVRPDGIILANVGFGLARLTAGPGHAAHGPFLDYASFMPLRHNTTETATTARDVLSLAEPQEERRIVPFPARELSLLDERMVHFLRSVLMPGVTQITEHGPAGDEYVLAHPASRSWARARTAGPGTAAVAQGGPRRLWDEVVSLTEEWLHAGRPGITSYGLTVTNDGEQQLWLHSSRFPVASA